MVRSGTAEAEGKRGTIEVKQATRTDYKEGNAEIVNTSEEDGDEEEMVKGIPRSTRRKKVYDLNEERVYRTKNYNRRDSQ